MRVAVFTVSFLLFIWFHILRARSRSCILGNGHVRNAYSTRTPVSIIIVTRRISMCGRRACELAAIAAMPEFIQNSQIGPWMMTQIGDGFDSMQSWNVYCQNRQNSLQYYGLSRRPFFCDRQDDRASNLILVSIVLAITDVTYISSGASIDIPLPTDECCHCTIKHVTRMVSTFWKMVSDFPSEHHSHQSHTRAHSHCPPNDAYRIERLCVCISNAHHLARHPRHHLLRDATLEIYLHARSVPAAVCERVIS